MFHDSRALIPANHHSDRLKSNRSFTEVMSNKNALRDSRFLSEKLVAPVRRIAQKPCHLACIHH